MMAILQHNLTIDVFGIYLHLLSKITSLIGKYKATNGTWKIQVSGEPQTLMTSSTRSRSKKMIDKIKNAAMHYWTEHKKVVIAVAVVIVIAIIL